MRSLPIQRGYPVPWFVAMVNGEYHFPTADAEKMREALKKHLCWVCGQPLGSYLSFVVGPMAVVNRHTSEPPAHHECAVFSARACPFLARPHMKRQKEHAEGSTPPSGIFVERNPGAAAVWTTKNFWLRMMPNGAPLFRMGEPTGVLWFAEGHPATREQAQEALAGSLPFLHDVAKPEGDEAMKELDALYTKALGMLPT
jgi:hypothetical protein